MTRAFAVRRRLRSAPAPSLPPPKPIHPDVFYTEAETAQFLRLRNPKTLTVSRSRGRHRELRFVKQFNRVLYEGRAILDFLKGTAKAPEAPKRRKGGAE
jgi:hypothetical protein